ncbi:O-antigen polysaccharide polymerase Wzy family protein [Jeotgalibaca caeni]|uniref:O-antigen polysaccharide polymerase Wzy family protein n=1 Tax=Jeotgalibaca caeni TaxID=3028623 RepID=UPI00237D75D7|nr:O-antigen polysaccharide polymerase Wzy family protein [Jeotgalibaca caeni]MDE1549881.1 O-antigen polysaccharide polymerase Wzy family protein [Jeotgalibaca caeni]
MNKKIFKWNKKSIRRLLIGLLIFVSSYWFILNVDETYEFLFLVSFGYLIANIVYSALDYKNRFVFLMFNGTFFLFLLGSVVMSVVFRENNNILSQFNTGTIEHISFAIFLSLSTLGVTYQFLKTNNDTNEQLRDNSIYYVEMKKNFTLKKITFYILMISSIAKIISVTELVFFVRNASYYDYYTDFNSKLPSVVNYIASTYYILFYIYISTMPSKKEIRYPMFIYFLISFLILVSGERGEPISNIAVFILYIFIRNRKNHFDIKIKKKYTLIMLVVAPFIIYSLQVLHFERNNITTNFSLSEGILSFFESQGGSIKVIGYGFDYRDYINNINDANYTFGTLRNYATQNVLSRFLFGIPPLRQNTVEMATSGVSLNQVLSYIRFPNTYVQGRGMGSSYIAELFHDFGYIGIVTGNIILAYIISKIENFNRKSPYMIAIYLNIVKYIILLPRGASFSWFTSTFSVQNILLIFLLKIIENEINIKKENKNEKIKSNISSYTKYGGLTKSSNN